MSYRAGIVGLTGIGAKEASEKAGAGLALPMPGSHAAAYAALPNTEVVAVCDLKPELLEQFGEKWGEVWPEVACHTDYRTMLSEARLDILSVVTSDNAHVELVVDACAAGVRAIFCEKPIATTLEDADRMIAACENAGVAMSIDHLRRWWPLYNHVRDRIRAGDIGPIVRVLASLGGPRAMLFRNGTHLIDTVLMMVESEPEWVFAELDPGFEDYFAYRGDGGRDPAGDPGGSGYIHFRSGARAFINASKGTPGDFSLDLIGETGRIHVSDQEGATVYTDGRIQKLREPQFRLTGLAAGIDELIRYLEGRTSQLSSPPGEARKVLQVILGFLKSQELGNRRVDLVER
jgi:predicted dehydrogenase